MERERDPGRLLVSIKRPIKQQAPMRNADFREENMEKKGTNREAESAANAETIMAVWRNTLHRSMHKLANITLPANAGSDNTVGDIHAVLLSLKDALSLSVCISFFSISCCRWNSSQ